MANDDPVREFLRERGCGRHTVEGGMVRLIEGWEATVRSVEAGYSLGLDDYLNEMDARQLIEGALARVAGERRAEFDARVARADETMQSLVVPLDRCLWGEAVAEQEGWTAEDNWWYYAAPRAAADLRAEIAEALSDEDM
jgi:hypothetical protein